MVRNPKPKARCPRCKKLICISKLTKSMLNYEYICHGCLFFENVKLQKQIAQSDDIFFKGNRITPEDKKKATELLKIGVGVNLK